MRALVATVAAALLLPAAATASPAGEAREYLFSRAQASGGFAEPGRAATPGLTAWAVLGLRAAGVSASRLAAAGAYLEDAAPRLDSATDLELALLALSALGDPPRALVERVRALRRADGSIGPTVNSTIWGLLALKAAGEPAPPGAVRYLLRRQHRSGGWSWVARGAPDSNDTAAAIQALRSAGMSPRHRSIRRAVAYLGRHRNRDGGFELVAGRGSDVQSTAWAVQALVAARRAPGAGPFRYLARMRRADGSYRYSARYVATPVWVTAQALAALARRPLPIR